jgi:23S rRNA pseudouridine1911/1915/1917 synthase
VLVNGRPTKANYKVRPGDVIELTLMKPPPIELIAQDIPLDIRYEDADLLVVYKPAGMVTHPAYGNRDGTLVNAVLHHVGAGLLASAPSVEEAVPVPDDEAGEDEEEDVPGAEVRPGIVHRLDKDTSGLMVVAKDPVAQVSLAKQFADRTVKREYWAVVWGIVDADEGEIEGNLARDPRDRKRFAVTRRDGKYALTRYRVLERFEFATLLALRLATGRTHQIRVHCAHIGHPLFGDTTYGGDRLVYPGSGAKHRQRVANLVRDIGRQALHAKTLGFIHPRTREWMEFDSELPADMERLVDALRNERA